MDIEKLSPEERRTLYLRTVEPLWRRGNLRFKLDTTQQRIYDALVASTERKFFLNCSRRLGKSFMLVCLAFERAIKQPGARILYLAPWAKDAADIAGDLAAKILDDCPPDLKPEYKAQEKSFIFPNGSIIRLKGTNGEHAQFIRGGDADIVILDECGLMDELKHVVADVVMPMTLTTGGRILLASTPPVTPGHDSTVIYEQLAGKGAVAKFTILDNVRVPDSVKEEFLIEAGEQPELAPLIVQGLVQPQTTTARREYFCEFVTDASSAVIPEFTAKARSEMVVSSLRPPYFDAYVAMDPGMVDRCGILYGYWDFLRSRLVIEDESLLQGPSTTRIAAEIQTREEHLWGYREPYMRVSDVDLRLIADLWERHKLRVSPVQKQDSEGAINLVRTMVLSREIEIHPRCKHLVRQMENATWNNKVTDFARAGRNSQDGHYDLVAALKYLCRSVNRRKNPYPEGWGRTHDPNEFQSPKQGQTGAGLGLYANTPIAKRIARSRSKNRPGL